MADLRVGILGPFVAMRDAQTIRLRTRPQALLLARLALRPVSREEIADRLWPETSSENALSYLRRARQELRAQGFDVLIVNGVLRLAPEIASDLAEARQTGLTKKHALSVLAGFDGPVAEEIRRAARREARQDAPLRPLPCSRTASAWRRGICRLPPTSQQWATAIPRSSRRPGSSGSDSARIVETPSARPAKSWRSRA